jgi:galactokinase
MNASELAVRFQTEFGAQPNIFSAPGRVNLIGEHTDYNDGFVLPSAIGFYTHVAISPRSDCKLVLRSMEFVDSFEFDLEHMPSQRIGSWCDYVLGVALVLRQVGSGSGGANLLVHGEVPIGAGLSSSASIEVASAMALQSLSPNKIPITDVPRLCQKAENEFVGARVGIMDQFVSCLGKAGHALLLDCRSLAFELVPIPPDVKLVVCNTMVKHELSGGEYNQRREQCEQGVRILSQYFPGVKALRDVSIDQLRNYARALPPIIYNRCRHVVEENQRVQQTVQAFRSGDLNGVGKLMRESHASLRDLYEVSCRELDIMVASAEDMPGFYGGRMTGGGFGGCTVNLVAATHAENFRREVGARYQRETGISPEIYVCSSANGAAIQGT